MTEIEILDNFFAAIYKRHTDIHSIDTLNRDTGLNLPQADVDKYQSLIVASPLTEYNKRSAFAYGDNNSIGYTFNLTPFGYSELHKFDGSYKRWHEHKESANQLKEDAQQARDRRDIDYWVTEIKKNIIAYLVTLILGILLGWLLPRGCTQSKTQQTSRLYNQTP